MAQTAMSPQVQPYQPGQPYKPYGGSHFKPRRYGHWKRAPVSGWRSVSWVVVLSGLVTVFSWRPLAWRPALSGLDSWQGGIALAFMDHLQWGKQAVFTYGPFGFVEDILPFSHLTAGLGIAYALAVIWGLAALILCAVRPWCGLLPAAVVAWVALAIAANMVEAPELGTALSLGLAIAVLQSDDRPVLPRPNGGADRSGNEALRIALLGLAGAFAALQLLVEIDVGVVALLLSLAAAAGQRDRGRALAVTGGIFALSGVALLLAASQNLGNFPSYIHGSLSVLFGYSGAMGRTSARGAENWYGLVDLGLLAVVYAVALKGRPRAEQLGLGIGLAGWAWAIWKEGFVRHDTHDLVFFALLLVALCLARLPRAWFTQAIAIAAALVLALLANGSLPRAPHSPVEDVRALVKEVRAVVVPGQWAGVEEGARLDLRASGDTLSPGLLASLAGRTVAAFPMEDALSFAYPSLRWDPIPVLQGYSAYTGYLDHLDSDFLASPRAPQRILYRLSTIDGRNPAWDPPAATVALYCNYVPLGETDGWTVLARGPARCGAPRLIGRVTAHFGQVVPVPHVPQGAMLVATFALSSPLTARAEGFVLKPPAVYATADRAYVYRFIAGTAADYHVMSPRGLGYPEAAAPLAVHTLEFSGNGWAPGQGSVSMSLYTFPIRSR